MRAWRCRGLVLVLLIALTPAAIATAATSGDPDKPYDAGWTLFLDNDLLALLSRDQQYTGAHLSNLQGGEQSSSHGRLIRSLAWLTV